MYGHRILAGENDARGDVSCSAVTDTTKTLLEGLVHILFCLKVYVAKCGVIFSRIFSLALSLTHAHSRSLTHVSFCVRA